MSLTPPPECRSCSWYDDRMDPWKRFRLLACIVGMLGLLCAGGVALAWRRGSPSDAREGPWIEWGGTTNRRLFVRPDPILVIGLYYSPPQRLRDDDPTRPRILLYRDSGDLVRFK